LDVQNEILKKYKSSLALEVERSENWENENEKLKGELIKRNEIIERCKSSFILEHERLEKNN
jgi:hypothetical protein